MLKLGIIESLEPLYSRLPAVKGPEKQLDLVTKIKWSSMAVLLFFLLGEVKLIGITPTTAGFLEQFQLIVASQIGTILTAGIGPIVIASLVLQLLVGSKIITLNMTDPSDRAKFMGVQKLLAITMCFFEPVAYAAGGLLAPEGGFGLNFNTALVVGQVALGSLILLYLDELSSKWGLGWGIGLFIAAGVSQSIIWRFVNPFTAITDEVGRQALWFASSGTPEGLVLSAFYWLLQLDVRAALLAVLPIAFTIAVFLAVAFVEGMHIDLPLMFGSQGIGTRFPIKLLYASNIPVIFASMLFANVQLMASVLQGTPVGPFLGQYDAANQIVGGFALLTQAPFGYVLNTIGLIVNGGVTASIDNALPFLHLTGVEGILQQLPHALGYFVLLTVTATGFGLLWLEVSGTGPETLAEQLHSQGHQIAGYRRDPRIMSMVLYKYIPAAAFVGSAAVGMLAAGADIFGAIGSGTGILLTVGILYRQYEELKKLQDQEQNPILARFLA